MIFKLCQYFIYGHTWKVGSEELGLLLNVAVGTVGVVPGLDLIL